MKQEETTVSCACSTCTCVKRSPPVWGAYIAETSEMLLVYNEQNEIFGRKINSYQEGERLVLTCEGSSGKLHCASHLLEYALIVVNSLINSC